MGWKSLFLILDLFLMLEICYSQGAQFEYSMYVLSRRLIPHYSLKHDFQEGGQNEIFMPALPSCWAGDQEASKRNEPLPDVGRGADSCRGMAEIMISAFAVIRRGALDYSAGGPLWFGGRSGPDVGCRGRGAHFEDVFWSECPLTTLGKHSIHRVRTKERNPDSKRVVLCPKL